MIRDIVQFEFDSGLTDEYWALLCDSDSDSVDPDRILLMIQYMFTAYLSTLPDQQDVQVQVLALLRELLPKLPLSSE